jgi:hypothetical protein
MVLSGFVAETMLVSLTVVYFIFLITIDWPVQSIVVGTMWGT